MKNKNLFLALVVAFVLFAILAPVIPVSQPIVCGPLESCAWTEIIHHESLTFYLFGLGTVVNTYS
jgi:hypothetical protein